jgi:hypothetical protein
MEAFSQARNKTEMEELRSQRRDDDETRARHKTEMEDLRSQRRDDDERSQRRDDQMAEMQRLMVQLLARENRDDQSLLSEPMQSAELPGRLNTSYTRMIQTNFSKHFPHLKIYLSMFVRNFQTLRKKRRGQTRACGSTLERGICRTMTPMTRLFWRGLDKVCAVV